ncbi:UTP--glucose-1-phosphate uridylyltransferase [Peribacillus sp. SCS-26]|uniref:UTP--glucose-1-phosphate uridylyltransferase n=1 Tax=Paraperibacillus marinus TaxID=3115295 RepID=UPI003905B40B
MDRYNRIREELSQAGQAHLLQFFDELTPGEQESLLDEIENINLDEINSAAQKLLNPDPPAQAHIEPVPYDILEEMEEDQKRRYEQKGLDLIAGGRAAVVLLAGGQGTRLGHNGPKGTFDIGLPGHESLFEIQAGRLLKLQERTGTLLPWYIMTSPINDRETRDFFESHDYFGYDPSLVTFFIQPTAPTLTPGGKIMLKSKSQLSLSPNGNGGVFSALKSSGALADMENRGVKWVFLYNVDNAIIQIADPLFIGFAEEKNTSIATKSTAKRSPDEKVGVFCLMDGKPSVIEYSEMTQEEREHPHMTNAHISIHLFKLAYLKDMSDKSLPYHFAHKAIPGIDENGIEMKPDQPNGYKLEQFYFDLFPEADGISVLQVPREKEFAPVKNRSGEDSPESARKMVMAQEK